MAARLSRRESRPATDRWVTASSGSTVGIRSTTAGARTASAIPRMWSSVAGELKRPAKISWTGSVWPSPALCCSWFWAAAVGAAPQRSARGCRRPHRSWAQREHDPHGADAGEGDLRAGAAPRRATASTRRLASISPRSAASATDRLPGRSRRAPRCHPETRTAPSGRRPCMRACGSASCRALRWGDVDLSCRVIRCGAGLG